MLARLRSQHFDELEADFQQYYNLDISQVPRARAARLLYQLPQNCRTFCKIEPANQWGWREILLNKANYTLELLAWQNTQDATKKPPRNIPKPFIPDFMRNVDKTRTMSKDSVALDVDDMREFLSRPRR